MENTASIRLKKISDLVFSGKILRLLEHGIILAASAIRGILGYDRLHILVNDGGKPLVQGRTSSMSIRQATVKDIPALNKLDPQEEGVLEERFANDDVPFVAELEGNIIAVKWLRFSSVCNIEEAEYKLLLPENSMTGLAAFVEPKYRLSGAWVNITNETTRYAKSRSVKWIFSYINGINDRSRETHLKYGSRLAEQVVHIRLFALRLYLKWIYDITGKSSFGGLWLSLSPMNATNNEFQRVAISS